MSLKRTRPDNFVDGLTRSLVDKARGSWHTAAGHPTLESFAKDNVLTSAAPAAAGAPSTATVESATATAVTVPSTTATSTTATATATATVTSTTATSAGTAIPIATTGEVSGTYGTIKAHWTMHGSQQYTISLNGHVSGGSTKSLSVVCSCPDGDHQAQATRLTGQLRVCKHGYACLQTVIDTEESDRHDAAEAEVAKAKAAAEAEVLKAQAAADAEVCKAQEETMSGERARVDHVLTTLTADNMKDTLLKAVKTVDGLRLLASLFPAAQYPAKTSVVCLRCHKTYDQNYPSRCEMDHPEAACQRTYKDMKGSDYECRRCGSEFHVDGWSCICEAGCFDGPHESADADKIKREGWDEFSDDGY